MKKIGLAIILLIGLITTTGCSDKKLVCTLAESDTGRSVATKLEVYFNGKKASVVKENMDIKFEDQYRKTINTLYKVLEEQYKDYKKADGVVVKLSKDKSNIHVKINIDIKTKENSDSTDNLIDVSASKNQIKKDLEKTGYTCK